ncbi:type II toxin-antitoxin system RelE/ParE family toxin [Puia dinghuensis]|uniref:type II toxin-antitoxin system RelE/ParE family toxin n=1 Tax=Puia dinghuensis TaxID=1792502 RepID=UPI001668B8E9
MILSFGSKETENIWNGFRVKSLPIEIQQIGRRKLRMLNNCQNLIDASIPPANRLEKLSGKGKDFYSIRINDQWRIVFKWDKGNALEVEILDYHK